ncbi:hypothetical protein BU23DRAFT_572714 [Bimuria novae-zelandiae CBS 107.79]|uniref:Uncharacterized protein n=1 Tax=Bimuria novae-zelandiae CBS 107.79 TaxID=1447943 RepID=A0A6A5UYU9_9PLEO|nr:hypothetical protein BU23DRAFT_572714 [Bimuria novae-zelandiae CBS 107.79]
MAAAAAVQEPDRRIHNTLVEALEPIQATGTFAVTGLLPADLKPKTLGSPCQASERSGYPFPVPACRCSINDVTINPIVSGVRLVMAYQLSIVSNGDDPAYRAPSDGHAVYLEALLQSWNTDVTKGSKPHALAYKLEHKYGDRNQIHKHLQGNDLVRVHALQQACDNIGLKIFLGSLKKDITSEVEIDWFEAVRYKSIGTLPDIDYDTIIEDKQIIDNIEDLNCSAQYLIANKGWGEIHEPDPDIYHIFDWLLDHNDLVLRSISGGRLLARNDLEKLAIVAIERGYNDLFRRACTQLVGTTQPNTLVNFLALNLFQTARFDEVDFWVSIQLGATERIKASDEFVVAFTQTKRSWGLLGGTPDIHAWQVNGYGRLLPRPVFQSSTQLSLRFFFERAITSKILLQASASIVSLRSKRSSSGTQIISASYSHTV